MTPQERDLLTRFLEQLRGAQAGPKDAEAQALISDACARQPDAAYLLVQRTLQFEQLLNASQKEVQKLQADLDQARPSPGGSFLNDPNAWGSRPSAPAPQNPGAQRIPGTGPGMGMTPAAQQPMPGPAAAAAPVQRSSWGGGLFGNIATTAAGVVAGSFLYQGIQGLMHRNDTHNDASGDNGPQHHEASSEPELLNSYNSDDQVAAAEPELLNTYETPADSASDTFASGFDDSSESA